MLFRTKVLNKYTISYYKCNNCKFINTEEPFWLEEAYGDAIASLDIGLVSRNRKLEPIVTDIIYRYFNKNGIFLDYAGGYGLFVRIMRDNGFDFFRHDVFCQNLFAQFFDIENFMQDSKFELITAFEFLEHCKDPLSEMTRLLSMSDSVLFSTSLHKKNITSVNDWWYFVPETGQHISFFSIETLENMARSLAVQFYTNGHDLHLFTRQKYYNFCFQKKYRILDVIIEKIVSYLGKRTKKNRLEQQKYFIGKDYQYVKKILGNQKSKNSSNEK
ncbi:class I SAM-dependent methyltransferase [Candidatus Electrothrix sp.]|uniref:class I SAM-dependent methyltransferase n=1 Tax=Candidatus Electrothrix sp. TaxID=2170559 RepID=UPI0040576D58